MKLIVNKQLRRQIPVAGPWLLWHRTPVEDGDRGLVLSLQSCIRRNCNCRIVDILANPTFGSLQQVTEKADGQLVARYPGSAEPPLQPCFSARVDFATGRAEYDSSIQVDEATREFFERHLDGEFLDVLYDRWLLGKSLTMRPHFSDGPWTDEVDSRLIGYSEAFPDARVDLYELPEGTFERYDHYCLAPKCQCGNVQVDFMRVLRPDSPTTSQDGRQDDYPRAGSLVYDILSQTICEVESVPGWETTFQALCDAFNRRFPDLHFLADRHEKMQEVGRQVRERTATPHNPGRGSRVGRNDPCPCGSQKKYKKCCLGKSSDAVSEADPTSL